MKVSPDTCWRSKFAGVYSSEAFTRESTVSTEDAALSISLPARRRRGDPGAGPALPARSLWSVRCRLLNHRHDAEDVDQEVFLRVFRSLKAGTRPAPQTVDHGHRGQSLPHLAGPAPRRAGAGRLPPGHQCRARCGRLRRAAREIQAALSRAARGVSDGVRAVPRARPALRGDRQALERPVGTIKTWLHRARLEILNSSQHRGMIAPDEEAARTAERRSR